MSTAKERRSLIVGFSLSALKVNNLKIDRQFMCWHDTKMSRGQSDVKSLNSCDMVFIYSGKQHDDDGVYELISHLKSPIFQARNNGIVLP